MKHKIVLLCICLLLCTGILSGCNEKPVSTDTGISNMQELVDAPKGYKMYVPADMTFDFSLARSYTKCVSEEVELFISRETSAYEDVIYYINNNFDFYTLSPSYRDKNNIDFNCNTIENINGKRVKILSVTRRPYDGSQVKLNTYTYVYILNDDPENTFFRIMMKSKKFDKDSIIKMIETFEQIKMQGDALNAIDMTPVLPNWNAETKAFYEAFCNRNEVMWGIFVPEAVSPDGYNESIPNLESQLEYNFELCMQYSHIPHDLPPVKGLQEAYEDGKTTVLTIQISTLWNNDRDKSVNPNFEVIDGKRDEEISAYAKMVKAFGHPVFLRINNEMNTDWTSYAGVSTLGDLRYLERYITEYILFS